MDAVPRASTYHPIYFPPPPTTPGTTAISPHFTEGQTEVWEARSKATWLGSGAAPCGVLGPGSQPRAAGQARSLQPPPAAPCVPASRCSPLGETLREGLALAVARPRASPVTSNEGHLRRRMPEVQVPAPPLGCGARRATAPLPTRGGVTPTHWHCGGASPDPWCLGDDASSGPTTGIVSKTNCSRPHSSFPFSEEPASWGDTQPGLSCGVCGLNSLGPKNCHSVNYRPKFPVCLPPAAPVPRLRLRGLGMRSARPASSPPGARPGVRGTSARSPPRGSPGGGPGQCGRCALDT